MDKVSILYDGIDPFYPQPTPFVGKGIENIYYGELWAKQENLTLEGQISGCAFDDIVSEQQRITNNFKKNYQTLEIWQEEGGVSGRIFQKDLCEINSISFPQDRWIGVLPYTIEINCYPSGYFSGAYGVLEPVDSWQLQENENYTLNATHTISCRGLNTSSSINNALENAKNWVLTKRNFNSYQVPAFIENASTGNFCLLTTEETIDRFNGVYGIIDSYSSDLLRTGYGILRYTTSFESGENAISVQLNGEINGCGQNIESLRQVFSGLNKFATAQISYNKIFNRNDLNPNPLIYSVSEDVPNNTISFNYSFNNDNSPEVAFDYNVSLTSGQLIGAAIQGNIIVRGGTRVQKLEKAKAYVSGLNLYNLTTEFYNEFYPYANLYPLNTKAITSGITINEFQGTVGVNAEFNNKIQTPSGLEKFDYTLDFAPSIYVLDSKSRVNGSGIYSIVDLNFYTRGALTVNGNAVISSDNTFNSGLDTIKKESFNLFSQYGTNLNPILEVISENTNRKDKKQISFNYGWSFDTNNQVFTAPNYSGVETLEF